MERAQLVSRMYAELVGPRLGPNEVLPPDQSPRDEYLVGALEPELGVESPDPDKDVESFGEWNPEAADDDDDGEAAAVCTTTVSPSLVPKSLARSIGLSFAVTATSGVPRISICALWARYTPDSSGFRRHPRNLIDENVGVDQLRVWRDGTGIEVHMRSVQRGPNTYRVSLFLRNRTVPTSDKRVAVNEYIFQPEIRVRVGDSTQIVPVGSESSDLRVLDQQSPPDGDGPLLDLLYAKRRGYARGHLCGATWSDIDPERAHPDGLAFDMAPFFWTDQTTVEDRHARLFALADVRTVLVPLYPVQTASMEWRSDFGPAPELDPGVLAELWESSDLDAALRPLVRGYDKWIAKQREAAQLVEDSARPLAMENIAQCTRAMTRIAAAIDQLKDDEDARLAFCLANKAIKLQARWAGRGLRWRPFQLAFILLNIRAITDTSSPDRGLCDLLWFPTGGGKTEAYLGLTAFVLALRRRRALGGNAHWGPQGGGPGVLSRYTLRLLTIQQFRRALGVILALEKLRVDALDRPGSPVGWRPSAYPGTEPFIWGGLRFSAGLWVGNDVTPNSLRSIGPLPMQGGWKFIAGALDILQGASSRDEYLGPNAALQRRLQNRRSVSAKGDPAQVAECPCCKAILAIGDEGLNRGRHVLRFLISAQNPARPPIGAIDPQILGLTLTAVDLTQRPQHDVWLLSVSVEVAGDPLTARQVDEWWYGTLAPAVGRPVTLLAARPARPGYFISTYDNSSNLAHQSDFEIYCVNDACELNNGAWAELVPLARNDLAPRPGSGLITLSVGATDSTNALPGIHNMAWQKLGEVFRHSVASPFIGDRIPISAFTTDEQIYHRCPSLIIATVDKLARLAYESKASGVFGNVNFYHSRFGYYRENCPPSAGGNLPSSFRAHPAGANRGALHVPVNRFRPPDLVLQDELHLIEGPLGSLVGLYETAVDTLSSTSDRRGVVRPKYASSTATTKQANTQVQALFDRELFLFPPAGITADDRFFALEKEVHPLDETTPGRLYVGVAAPGRGAQTPIVRIWSVLLQTAHEAWEAAQTDVSDQFYTLVGYFNAIRELAGAVSLYRQDIPERMAFRFGATARQLSDSYLELAGRTPSLDLPMRLAQLEARAPLSPSVVCATSMFGTGVDVGRLGLMVVHGQPKNTASYIQAAGRVGRQHGGLVVTFLRASRPRDLDHYEYFTGYHRALHRFVEPVTLAPFSPRARERALGAIAVVLLRHASEILGNSVDANWRIHERLSGAWHSEARRMSGSRHSPEVRAISRLLERRAQTQPSGRRPEVDLTMREADSEIDRWALIARNAGTSTDTFVYSESAYLTVPTRHVVLGDAQHAAQGLLQAFRHPPQSLRDVEETTGFET